MIALVLAFAAQAATPDLAMVPYADERDVAVLPGGRRIGLHCTGEAKGGPTVILTAGAGGWGVGWRMVQPVIARRTRVCAWDRAGFGLSDPSPAPQDAATTTADLAAALAARGVAGPYVMVGHSAGAYETLRFADTHRRAVAGMVLVDPSLPDQFALFARVAPAAAKIDDADLADGVARARRCAAVLGAGLPAPRCTARPGDEPPALAALLAARAADPARHATIARYFAAFPASAAAIADPKRDYGAMPLIVLTAAFGMAPPPDADASLAAEFPRMQAAWVAGHDALARLSRVGVNRTVANTGHLIPTTRPEAVIAAIDEVLDLAAKSRPR